MERRRVERGFFSRFMRYWLPVLIYLTVIFSLSAQPNLRPPVQFRNSDKLYHLLEYAGLGFLLTRALRAELGTGPAIAVGSAVLVLGSLVAAADETFQRSVPGRESSALDWVADTAGVALAQGLVLWLLGTRRREDRWL